jgi:hypothetical protein
MKTSRNRLQLLPRGLPRCARYSRPGDSRFTAGARLAELNLPTQQHRLPVLSWQADSVPVKVIVKS